VHDIQTKIDPRVLRTRQLLLNSFSQLKQQHSSINAISVLDIARLAGVNRATFYAHFTDKYQILDIWMRDFFKNLLTEKLPNNLSFNDHDLNILLNATMEVLELHNQQRKATTKQYEPMFDNAIREELKDTLKLMVGNVDLEKNMLNPQLFSFLSWAILGAVKEAAQNKPFIKDEITKNVTQLIKNTVSESFTFN
jgi:AcrR family transcriptional regulator